MAAHRNDCQAAGILFKPLLVTLLHGWTQYAGANSFGNTKVDGLYHKQKQNEHLSIKGEISSQTQWLVECTTNAAGGSFESKVLKSGAGFKVKAASVPFVGVLIQLQIKP